MTKTEMVDAIREIVGEHEMVNIRSIAFKRWRRIFIGGMREAAEIAENHADHDSGPDPLACQGCAEVIAETLREKADELSKS